MRQHTIRLLSRQHMQLFTTERRSDSDDHPSGILSVDQINDKCPGSKSYLFVLVRMAAAVNDLGCSGKYETTYSPRRALSCVTPLQKDTKKHDIDARKWIVSQFICERARRANGGKNEKNPINHRVNFNFCFRFA